MESCLYTGSVRHRRREPVEHEFRYPLFMLYLDLDELEEVFAGRILWSASRPALARFHRADHLGAPTAPLADSVKDLVESKMGARPDGPVRLLTQLRYLGYGFNPVSFYYCFDASGESVSAIVAEINNTPWGEQYPYVLPVTAPGRLQQFSLTKDFHISPFMHMDLTYDWRFTEPSESLVVHMTNLDQGRKIFDATLQLEREPLSSRALNEKLLRYPLMSFRVITGIYWQAFKLWWKNCPFYPHPDSQEHTEAPSRIP